MDGQLALDFAEALPRVVGKADEVSRGIETPLCGLEGRGSNFDRHMATSDSNSRPSRVVKAELPLMRRPHLATFALIALVALATGFVLAGQIRAQLLTPSNQLARYQALVRNVQELEATNGEARRQIASLRAHIDALESDAASRSAATQTLRSRLNDLRAHAGLVAMHGPGIEVSLRNGVPGPDTSGKSGYLVNFQDVQDVVNLLFAQGAEGIAVNGRRITPLSAFYGSEGQIVVDQGTAFSSPVKVAAVGDRNRMQEALNDPSALPDIRARQVQFQLHLTLVGSPDISLPAYDSSLQISHVSPV